jgi:hypothetical protein
VPQRPLAQFPTRINRENILKNGEFLFDNREFVSLGRSLTGIDPPVVVKRSKHIKASHTDDRAPRTFSPTRLAKSRGLEYTGGSSPSPLGDTASETNANQADV